jgi:hypothetical protein
VYTITYIHDKNIFEPDMQTGFCPHLILNGYLTFIVN